MERESRKWITPLMKQAFVVAGVSLNMSNMGSVMGFPAVLLPQLAAAPSSIHVDTASSSWIASIVGISLIAGNLSAPSIMGRWGRKAASLASSLLLITCWISLTMARDVKHILGPRFLQGFALGINLSLSPIMIGELTSPRNRGIFSSIMASTITAATLAVHVMGSYLTWDTTAMVFAFISLTSFAILLFTPESPSWLVDKGKFDRSKKSFNWLRGHGEDEEIEKMFQARRARIARVELSSDSNSGLTYFINAFKKKEFYKPVVIMIHLYTQSLWTGMCFLIVYTVDVIKILAGEDVDTALHLTLLDSQRMISTILALYAVKVARRRVILFTTTGVNLLSLVAIAGYVFAKTKGVLPFDHPAIGLVLMHIHMCSLTTGPLPLPLVIASELFPLEFRSLAGGISAIAFSVNYFVTSKTAMYLLNSIGIYGAYALYAAVTFYCMVVLWIMLPETKDRTLHDIEEEFRGKPHPELAVKEPLTGAVQKEKESGEKENV